MGDLTSRLGADCQQVSRVIGNDLNLIMRNILQVDLFVKDVMLIKVIRHDGGFNWCFFILSGGRFINLLVDFVLATWFMYIDDMLHISSSYVTLWKVNSWLIFFKFVLLKSDIAFLVAYRVTYD